MRRTIAAAGILSVVSLATLPGAAALAVTAKQKLATCNFGADNQKLVGEKRDEFLKRCMSDENEPRGPVPIGEEPSPKGH